MNYFTCGNRKQSYTECLHWMCSPSLFFISDNSNININNVNLTCEIA